jgi:hypothetical protein
MSGSKAALQNYPEKAGKRLQHFPAIRFRAAIQTINSFATQKQTKVWKFLLLIHCVLTIRG